MTIKNVVVLASSRWDNPYSSTAFSLAKALAQHTRVFFIDNPVTLTEFIRHRNSVNMQKRKNALISGEDIFHVPDPNLPSLITVTAKFTFPINWLPKGGMYDRWSSINASRVASTLNQLFRIFGIGEYVFLNSFNPLYGSIIDQLHVKPICNIYQSVDDIRYAPYLSRHGVRLENGLMMSADFSLVTSSHLLDLKRNLTDRVSLLPNAANTQLFSRALREDLPVPVELRNLNGQKVITYVGNICQRIDYVLLKKLAAAHRDKLILMVGPEAKVYGNRSKTYADQSGLKAFANVNFVGPKPGNELPSYLRYSDCCVIPFLCNELTKSIYPLKINEYLSAGKPVITTPFSQDVMGFSPVSYVSEDDSHFVSLIDRAIDEDSQLKRIDRQTFSSSNSWEARAHHFIDSVVEFLKHDDRRTGQPYRRARVQAHHG